MKKLFLSILCGLFLATGINAASAANTNRLPLEGVENYDTVMTTENAVYSFVKDKEAQTTSSLATMLQNTGLIFRINVVLGAIAILFLSILGLKFVVSQGDEDHMSKYKSQFSYIILGLVIISVAEFVAFDFLDPSGTARLLRNEAFENAFYDKINQIKLFIEILIIGIALIKMLLSGYSLIVRSEEDESISKEKTFFQAFLFGSILILLAEVIARIFSGSKKVLGESGVDLGTIGTNVAKGAETGINEIVGIINFALSFLGIASLTMMILASVYYVMSFGDSDQMGRAKRIVISCAVGAIVSVSAFTIVRFTIGNGA